MCVVLRRDDKDIFRVTTPYILVLRNAKQKFSSLSKGVMGGDRGIE
jgi:hypothetical protein